MTLPAPLLNERQQETIRELSLRGFLTRFGIGPRAMVTLYRDAEMDGTATAQAPAECLVLFASREAQVERSAGTATAVRLRQGTLARPAPWDVRPGDRFSLPDGSWGRVTLVPMAELGVQRAEFELELAA